VGESPAVPEAVDSRAVRRMLGPGLLESRLHCFVDAATVNRK
jgi:hypothetical protein